MPSPIVNKALDKYSSKIELKYFEEDYTPSSEKLWEMAKEISEKKFGDFPTNESLNYAMKWYYHKDGHWDVTFSDEELTEEGLRDWFGKSKSKDGKSGWVNVVTGGTCASDEPGEGTPKCVSSAKRASMSKSERLSAQRRKKAADPGQQQKSGAAKPTYVSTDKKKKMNEAQEKDHEYSMARSEISTIMNAAKRLKNKMEKGEGNVEAWVQSKITKAADYLDSAADYVDSGEMKTEDTILEVEDKKRKGSGKKDACYHKVKARYRVWPSAYASGALVKCRKAGASNWGNKSAKSESFMHEACWKGYTQKGMKTMFGKKYPNCVKKTKKEEYVAEAIRVPSQNGNLMMVTFSWRARLMYIKMFFPETKLPNRKEVEYALNKVYPGARVRHHMVTPLQAGDAYLNAGSFEAGSGSVREDTEYLDEVTIDDSQDVTDRYNRSVQRRMRDDAQKSRTDQSEKHDNADKMEKRMSRNRMKRVYDEGVDKEEVEIDEAKGMEGMTQKGGHKRPTDKGAGLTQKGVEKYRRQNPGSKLQTAVTTPPSKLKPGSKAAKRRKSFCARSRSWTGERGKAARRRWNC